MQYPGGKGSPGVVQRIINQMPPHGTYLEPFLGLGKVMRTKRPAQRNYACEVNRESIERFHEAVGRVPKFAYRVWEADGERLLRRLPNSAPTPALAFCDPPYPIWARASSKPIYGIHEWSRARHVRFLNLVAELDYMVIVASNDNSLYRKSLAGWRSIEYRQRTRGGTTYTEVLFFNYPEPTVLHDWRFLGKDFRERERIKRLAGRWVANLKRRPALERTAILSKLKQELETA